MNYLLLIDLA